MNEILLDIKDLNFTFDEKNLLWVKGLNLTLQTGEIILITGPSGAGKSTLLNALLNLCPLKYIRGKIRLNPSYAYMTTKNYFLETETILKNILYYYDYYNFTANLDNLLRYLKTKEVLDLKAPVATLSFGTKRRLALYRTLNIDAPYYLLDEPTTGFDAQKINDAYGEIKKMHEENKSFIIVSHESETAELADKIVFISSLSHTVTKASQNFYIKLLKENEITFKNAASYLNVCFEKVFQYKSSPVIIYRLEHPTKDAAIILNALDSIKHASYKLEPSSPFEPLVDYFTEPLQDQLVQN